MRRENNIRCCDPALLAPERRFFFKQFWLHRLRPVCTAARRIVGRPAGACCPKPSSSVQNEDEVRHDSLTAWIILDGRNKKGALQHLWKPSSSAFAFGYPRLAQSRKRPANAGLFVES